MRDSHFVRGSKEALNKYIFSVFVIQAKAGIQWLSMRFVDARDIRTSLYSTEDAERQDLFWNTIYSLRSPRLCGKNSYFQQALGPRLFGNDSIGLEDLERLDGVCKPLVGGALPPPCGILKVLAPAAFLGGE